MEANSTERVQGASEAHCPHCQRRIEYVTTKDILDTAGVSQATLVDWRQKGRFPQEWAVIARRPVWLRSDVADFLSSWESRRTDRVAENIEKLLADLSPLRQRQIVDKLEKELLAA